MWQALIGPITGIIGKAIDRAVPDKAEAERLKSEAFTQIATLSSAELSAVSDIIIAEAKGESWLQRNWRPMTMLTFAGLIVAHWLGWTAPGLSEDQVLSLLDIVKVGLGGYIVGRSAEKIMREYKSK